MDRIIKMIRDMPVSIERKSTTDIEVTINGRPVLIQTHRIGTLFDLIERCYIEYDHKNNAFNFLDPDKGG